MIAVIMYSQMLKIFIIPWFEMALYSPLERHFKNKKSFEL